MRRLLACALCALAACADRASDEVDVAADSVAAPAVPAAPFTIADVGLMTPESVLYDDVTDSYLVSNINGAPLGRDDNGFISRIRPDGTVEALKWIDGAADGVTLHAPKGMAFSNDTLFVADIDSLRMFDRTTGMPLGAYGVENASFLNDVAAASDGVYVTDTGVDASFQPDGRAAVYRFAGSAPVVVARGDSLRSPNGVLIGGGEMIIVPFDGNVVLRGPVDGPLAAFATLPGGQLDGVVRLGDGSLLVSSWETSSVYRVGVDGAVTTAVENVESPADLGWDSRRQRLLIPLFMGNAIEVREIPTGR